MKVHRSVTRRYASALFQIALAQQRLDAVEADLAGLDATLRAAPQLVRVLRAPTIGRARKHELLERAFADRIQPITLRLLHLLVDKRREEIVAHLHGEFQRLLADYRNQMAAEVTTAIPLDDALRRQLLGALEQRTGKRIELRERVDPEILGGVVVRLGDTVLDGSIRAQLRRLHARLSWGANGRA